MSGVRTLAVSPYGELRYVCRVKYCRLLSELLLASLLAACGGGGEGVGAPASSQAAVSPPAAPNAPPPAFPWTGHFVGTVEVAGQLLFGDAYLTTDGSVRLYIGGPYTDSGALQKTVPARSEQLVGSLSVSGDRARGAGLILGQQCDSAAHSPFCDAPASADMSMSLTPGIVAGINVQDIEGQIQAAASSGSETWLLHLSPWGPFQPLTVSKAQFKELLAEFASGGDTVIVFDDTGAMFFQSAHSGCVGNGMISNSVATLTIDNCNGAFAYLNGEYSGLATSESSSLWDYDSLLRVWLSKSPGAATPAALTMLAEQL
jgi:hypothetical protein